MLKQFFWVLSDNAIFLEKNREKRETVKQMPRQLIKTLSEKIYRLGSNQDNKLATVAK